MGDDVGQLPEPPPRQLVQQLSLARNVTNHTIKRRKAIGGHEQSTRTKCRVVGQCPATANFSVVSTWKRQLEVVERHRHNLHVIPCRARAEHRCGRVEAQAPEPHRERTVDAVDRARDSPGAASFREPTLSNQRHQLCLELSRLD